MSRVLRRALERHCTAVQTFTSSPSQWRRGPIDPEQAAALREGLAAADIRPHFVHAIYLLNLASPDRALWRRSVRHLAEELQRAALVGAAGVVFHLGSVGEGGRARDGVRRVAKALREARARAAVGLPLILENSAGAGYTLGGTPEQIGEIMAQAAEAEPLRLCLDTAHAFAAGLPVHTEEGLEEVLARVEAALGPCFAEAAQGKLAVIHLNDSRYAFASRHDRHWHIGQGCMGREALRRIINHPRLKALPMIMETPGTAEDDKRNMRAVRRMLPAEERWELRRRPHPARGRATLSPRRAFRASGEGGGEGSGDGTKP
jgi:deoxyribonuclease-4